MKLLFTLFLFFCLNVGKSQVDLNPGNLYVQKDSETFLYIIEYYEGGQNWEQVAVIYSCGNCYYNFFYEKEGYYRLVKIDDVGRFEVLIVKYLRDEKK